MKKVIALSLVCLLPALCLGQTPAINQVPNDVTVLEAGWRHGVDWRSPNGSEPGARLEQKRASNQLGPLDSEQTLNLRSGRDTAVVTVRNDGSKTIKAIRYDFIFVNTENGKEWFRYNFRHRVTIGAGETKSMTNEVVGKQLEANRPPNVDQAYGRNSQIRVEIKRIEYADGSQWRIH